MICYSIRLFIASSSRSLREGSLMFVVNKPPEDNVPQLAPLFRSSRMVSGKV
jgi:hypothetical protein